MLRIAFVGVAFSGKDFLGKYLIENQKFKRLAFGDELKRIANLIYPWLELDYDPSDKEKKLNITTEFGEKIEYSPREIWMFLNKLRNIDRHIYIRGVLHKLEKIESYQNVVITDLREKDEYDFLKKNNFIFIYIEPDKLILDETKSNEYDVKNVLPLKEKCDYIIKNNYNINTLKHLDGIINNILDNILDGFLKNIKKINEEVKNEF